MSAVCNIMYAFTSPCIPDIIYVLNYNLHHNPSVNCRSVAEENIDDNQRKKKENTKPLDCK